MIKVLKKNSTKFIEYSLSEFEKVMGFRWLKALEFQNESITNKIMHRCLRAHKKKELHIQERWLGVRYQKEILEGYIPAINIQWVSEDIGYGVFAEKEMAAGAYIGEYTGLVRKRTPRKDRKNNYCFTYSIGNWRRNPFIIDAKVDGNITRFINHSEEPNLDTLSVFADGIMHIILIARRPIKKKEQLTYHYGDIFWKKRPQAKSIKN